MKLNKMTLMAALALGGLLTLGTVVNAQDATNAPAMTPAPAHPPIRRGTPNIEMMAKLLNLSDEQKTNVLAAQNEMRNKMTELRKDMSIAPADRRPKMVEIHDAYTAKMKEILTPEQFAKFQKMAPGRRPAPAPTPAPSATAPAPTPN